jgi:hypothetical protein
MPALSIDHLQLDVPGLSEPEARDLAHRVAAGLASASGLPDDTNIPALRLDLAADGAAAGGATGGPGAAGDTASLAKQIVAAALRAISHAAAGTA